MSDPGRKRSAPAEEKRGSATAAQRPVDISLGRALWTLYSDTWLGGTRLSARMLGQLWPLFLLLATFYAGMEWAPADAGREFFSAAAQVIPVLLLALAVESRMLRLRRFRRHEAKLTLSESAIEAWHVVQERAPPLATWLRRLTRGNEPIIRHQTLIVGVIYGGLLLLMLVSAEWYCLDVLASVSEGQTRDPSLVSGAILAGLIAVGIIALVGTGEDHEEVAPGALSRRGGDDAGDVSG